MKKSIAVDMDGVLADVETHFLNWYNEKNAAHLQRRDIKGKTEAEAFPKPGIVREYASTKGFFSSVPLMPNAVEGLKILNEHFDVFIVSAAMEFPQSLVEKRDWLEMHFPFIHWQQIVFCGSKRVISTDFMIDDHPKNLNPFKGTGLLFEAFHNVDIPHNNRVKSWQEVLQYFKLSSS